MFIQPKQSTDTQTHTHTKSHRLKWNQFCAAVDIILTINYFSMKEIGRKMVIDIEKVDFPISNQLCFPENCVSNVSPSPLDTLEQKGGSIW